MDPATKNLYLEQLAKDARSVGGDVVYVNQRTPSMLGSGYAGSNVAYLPQKEYAVGDDVVFKNNTGNNSLHRVTHTKPGYVFTKGSFNTMGDGWIPLSEVRGKVVQTIRKKD